MCVATDVAARGLDLPDLGLVVHAELPVNGAVLLHRSGRTGRAGRKGKCVILVTQPRRRRAEALLAQARITAEWTGLPSAANILTQDNTKLTQDLAAIEATDEQEIALARELAQAHDPERIALAMIRLHRSQQPAPLDLPPVYVGPSGSSRSAPPLESGEATNASWFSLNVGRQANADPKWLIPLICRMGNVTKRDIGSIRIMPRETRFEIRDDIASHFVSSLPGVSTDGLRITGAEAVPANQQTSYSRGGKAPSRKRSRQAA